MAAWSRFPRRLIHLKAAAAGDVQVSPATASFDQGRELLQIREVLLDLVLE